MRSHLLTMLTICWCGHDGVQSFVAPNFVASYYFGNVVLMLYMLLSCTRLVGVLAMTHDCMALVRDVTSRHVRMPQSKVMHQQRICKRNLHHCLITVQLGANLLAAAAVLLENLESGYHWQTHRLAGHHLAVSLAHNLLCRCTAAVY